MILTDRTIKQHLESGYLGIEPLDYMQIGPASIDLRLGNTFLSPRAKEGIYSMAHEVEYDEVTGDWSALSTTVDLAGMTISASVKTFSLFGVGVPEVGEPVVPGATATAASEVTLPATGDAALDSKGVVAFIVLGLLLMMGGVAVIRRRSA